MDRTKVKNESAFLAWFKKQYGRTPSERKRTEARERIRELEAELENWRFTYRVEDNLFVCWTNALYGWNASKK